MSASEKRQFCVSVDVDEIHHYAAIHGLKEASCPRLAYELALDRLMLFADELDIKINFFVVASDLHHEASLNKLLEVLDRGHELGNHSLDHRYDFSRLDEAAMFHQIEGAQQIFEEKLGRRALGFRAPGYVINDKLYPLLKRAGHRYDSSVFPCPSYYSAKLAAIGLKALKGKRSHSIAQNPSMLLAPTQPYWAKNPYYRRAKGPEDGFLEIPICVTRGIRLPFIGTMITLFGGERLPRLMPCVIGQPLVNLELHAIDVLDCYDGLDFLKGQQPDISIPFPKKLEALARSIECLKEAGYAATSLDQVAFDCHED